MLLAFPAQWASLIESKLALACAYSARLVLRNYFAYPTTGAIKLRTLD